MFKRFTERARKVIILAREEAEKNQHEYLGTEHLLIGVLKDINEDNIDSKNIKELFK